MEKITAGSYQDLSKQAADTVINLMNISKNKLLCLASGDTPSGVYKIIVSKVNSGELNISDWKFVGLDEWGGMNGDDEGSCRYHLNQQFFHPLNIKKENICFFNGRANDLEKECQRTEKFIQDHEGIDVAILGLGLNGHIGMNEPGTSRFTHAHVSAIDPQTQQVGQKYFASPRQLSHGLTLGLANLTAARHLILLVNGSKKAAIVKRILEEEISEQLPASLLREHDGLILYLDSESAKLVL